MIEEFKWGVSNEIKNYFSEQKVETLDNAARFANDYSLTHNVIFSKSNSQQYSLDNKLFQSYGNTITSQSGTSSTNLSRNQASSNIANQKTLSDVFCYSCKGKGHLWSNCQAFKKQQLKESIKPTV